jgi:glycyl-tRNA synthetase beta chain
VLAADANDVVDAVARAEAVKQVMHMPEFQAIGAACKRMRNILRQAEEKGIPPAKTVESLADSPEEEKVLIEYLAKSVASVEQLRNEKEYLEALRLLATAREPVDRFFDKVMVMVEDERVRANRLALLRTLLREFSTIADFSEIVSEGKV